MNILVLCHDGVVRLYHEGDRGEPVRDIQGRLNALGFDARPDPTGAFGPGTRRAVEAFQTSRGLPGDGIVGPETWRALVDAGYRLGDRMLYRRVPMMRGDDVAELQRRLNALGFEVGKVDGIFGPETLRAVLDFQRNRNMAEDGIAGREVAAELTLMARATDKQGRELVRERVWLSSLPISISGARIYLDPASVPVTAGSVGEEEDQPWTAAVAARSALQEVGASVVLSRSLDTHPPERLRAQRANRLDVSIVVSLRSSGVEDAGVYFFASDRSHSAAGQKIAESIAARIGSLAVGRATPILKETRAPAVVVSADHLDSKIGIVVAQALIDLYSAPERGNDQPDNRR